MKHPPNLQSKRPSAFKISLLSFLLLLNQLLSNLWLDRHDTRMIHSNHLLVIDTTRKQRRLRLYLEGKPKPRIVFLEGIDTDSLIPARHSRIDLDLREKAPLEYALPKPHLCHGYPKSECRVPGGGKWQQANFPTCNSLHEIDLRSSLASTTSTNNSTTSNALLVGKGGKRLVWKILDYHSSPPQLSSNDTVTSVPTAAVALKMFKYRRGRNDFGPLSLDFQRRDAVIHQATAASPYIVNIQGFCGASGLFDFADGGDLQSNIGKNGPLQGEDLIHTAYQIAASIRDLHQTNAGRNNTPSIAHADVYGSQWVKVKGRYLLTDFNLAKFLTTNKTTQEVLPFRREVVDNWFAPEVHRQFGVDESIVDEKLDIWGLGNVLFLILTGTTPFQGLHRNEVHEMILDRVQLRPLVPSHIRRSPDYAHQAVLQAIDMCMVEDPKLRPTAKQVANTLKKSLQFLEHYESLEELNDRGERFPSVQTRVKHYMSSWYHLPCSKDPEAFVRYQPVPSTNASSNIADILIQAPSEDDLIVKIQSNLQTDDAMVLYPEMLQLINPSSTVELPHAGYRADIEQTLLPFWRALEEKPLVTQWGDKTSFVVSDLDDSHSKHPPLRIPHLKKCRPVLSKDQIEAWTQRGSCRDSNNNVNTAMPPILWKLDSHRLLGNVPLVPKNDQPWDQKEDKAVFRGRLTGHALQADRSVIRREMVSEEEYCLHLQRCRLVWNTHNSTLIDAKLTGLLQKPINSTIGGIPLVGDKLALNELLGYKAVIILEGNDVASGLGWSLRSNSVVMMPPPRWSSWLMEELLQPWEHYIPLDPSLMDVEEKMEWVLSHEEEAQEIANRASLWVKDLLEHPLSEKDNEEIFRRVLHRYQKQFVYSNNLEEKYARQKSKREFDDIE